MSKREMNALLDQMLHQMDRISSQWEQEDLQPIYDAELPVKQSKPTPQPRPTEL